MPANANMETWKNVTPGTVFIRRLDHRGELTRDEQIDAGKVFHVTPDERRINSEMAATEGLDVFRNGQFTPVRLLDDSDEARELANNPNVMSESDMKALLKANVAVFQTKVAAITNPTTLDRLLAIAHDQDVSIKRAELVKARLTQVREPEFSTIQSTQGPMQGPRKSRAITPR